MIHILLVDDHAIVRQGTRQLLEKEADMKVVGEASDGEEAIRLASELKPDVIIMDVAMPKLNGVQATKKIKEILPSTIILVMTGYDYDEYIFGLLEVGAAGYLLKDIGGNDLIAAVRAVYNGDPVLHPAVARRLMDHCKEPQACNIKVNPVEHELSEREMEVLKLAAKGISNKDIAEVLFISIRTVQAHMRSIFNKLGISSRSEAMIYGLKRGWFTVDDLPY
jgi:two-component system, NarL family, response regulator LiaR